MEAAHAWALTCARDRIARLLLLAVLGAALAACSPAASESPAEPAAVDLATEERAAYEASLASMRRELGTALDAQHRAEEALADARLGISPEGERADQLAPADARLGIDASESGLTARLANELEACRGEVARYREGLDRSVEELNRRRPPVAIRLPAREAPARDYGRVHTYTPRVKVHILGVLVEWSFYSTRDSATEGTAVIRLMEDGREVAVERQAVTVGANANLESSVMFHLTPNPTGIYTAQVNLEDRY